VKSSKPVVPGRCDPEGYSPPPPIDCLHLSWNCDRVGRCRVLAEERQSGGLAIRLALTPPRSPVRRRRFRGHGRSCGTSRGSRVCCRALRRGLLCRRVQDQSFESKFTRSRHQRTSDRLTEATPLVRLRNTKGASTGPPLEDSKSADTTRAPSQGWRKPRMSLRTLRATTDNAPRRLSPPK